ncbi:peptidase domain-containing ABC transporter [Thalassotalea montiporae]
MNLLSLDNVLNKESSVPFIRQIEGAECGLVCLAMIASYHGKSLSIPELRKTYSITNKGLTLSNLIDIAHDMEFQTRAYKVDLEGLLDITLPAVIHWDLCHYVVLTKVNEDSIVICDPSDGYKKISMADASKRYSGIVLECEKDSEFRQVDDQRKFGLKDIWRNVTGLNKNLSLLLSLTVIVQSIFLFSPFYIQLVIDHGIAAGDMGSITSLLFIFVAANFLLFFAKTLRSNLIIKAGSLFNFQLSNNTLAHLMKLPLSYFEKRSVGDVASRVESIEPIKKLVTEGIVESLIDSTVALAVLIIMFLYSPLLAIISLSFFLIFVCYKSCTFNRFKEAKERLIAAGAAEHSTFLETVKGMLSVKLFSKERDRHAKWVNQNAKVINSEIAVSKYEASYLNINTLLLGLENIIIVYFAASFVLNATFSLGQLFAFISYKVIFLEKASNLSEKYTEYRLLDLHFDRLSDIFFQTPEFNVENQSKLSADITPCIELKNGTFKYGYGDLDVLTNANLKIAEGNTTCIVGSSGAGKTTLMKVILGLLPLNAGTLSVGGEPLTQNKIKSFRQLTSSVMQEDQLFAGTIAENIACFSSEVDMLKVQRCCQIACIENEINKMPMQYETFIGDMGSSLSSGQKQRIFLARALYKEPKFLFIDEGTSNLDVNTELAINTNLRKLNITTLIIAHRTETIEASDAVYQLNSGQLECLREQRLVTNLAVNS